MIKKATFVECETLENTRFAPYAGYDVFIVDDRFIIFQDEVHSDFDIDENIEMFDITEEYS